MDGIASYRCVCLPGFTGPHCNESTEPWPCDPNPCENGGTCEELEGGGARCNCLLGFRGAVCESSASACVDQPDLCQNGGEITEQPVSRRHIVQRNKGTLSHNKLINSLIHYK